MTQRKGEVTKRQTDRDYPHQVAILIPIGGLGHDQWPCTRGATPEGSHIAREPIGDANRHRPIMCASVSPTPRTPTGSMRSLVASASGSGQASG